MGSFGGADLTWKARTESHRAQLFKKMASFREMSSRDETRDVQCGVEFVLSKSKDDGSSLSCGEGGVWLFQKAMPVAIRSHGDFASGSKFRRK